MMDNLTLLQETSQVPFHDKAVFHDISLRVSKGMERGQPGQIASTQSVCNGGSLPSFSYLRLNATIERAENPFTVPSFNFFTALLAPQGDRCPPPVQKKAAARAKCLRLFASPSVSREELFTASKAIQFGFTFHSRSISYCEGLSCEIAAKRLSQEVFNFDGAA